MSITLKSVAAALALAIAATSFASPAQAGNGRAVAAGVIGFSAGVIAGGALAGPHYYAPRGHQVHHRRSHHGPRHVVVHRPWSAAWIAHCRRTYVSFNPRTGYYVTYGGSRRFCR